MANQVTDRVTVGLPWAAESGEIVSATATELPPGSQPTVTLGGTPSERTLEFGIPVGEKGDPGAGSVNSVNGDLGPDIVLDAGDVGAVPDDQFSTTTQRGIVELATGAETVAGTDSVRAVTPAGLKEAFDARPSGGASADLIEALRYPVYIAHRGSPMCYPEHSIEGYRASYKAGFSPEADVVALADGTLVCLHDTTTNRTMDIQKPVNTVTVAEWRRATINPPSRQGGQIVGTGRGTPVFFEDYLDEFGGKVVLWPEIKTASAAPDIIQSVVDRGLHRGVVLQSSSLAVVQQVRAAGVAALMLGTTATPAVIEANGIEFVGVNSSTPQAFIDECVSRGIRVIGYTHNTKAAADAQLARGMSGVFSDDPWEVSRDYTPKVSLDISDGQIPPGSEHSRSGSASSGGPGTTQVVVVKNDTLYFDQNFSTDVLGGASSLKLGQFGYGGPRASVRFWVQSRGASSNTRWMFGLYLGRQEGDVAVNEEPGESLFRLVMVRRDGRKHVYEKRTFTSAVNLLESTAATTPPYAPVDGRSVPMLFEAEFYSNRVQVRNLTLNDAGINVSHAAWANTSDLYLTIGTSQSVSSIWGITCDRT